MATFGSLLVAPWILFAQMSWTTDAVPVMTATQHHEIEAGVEIRDRGEVFGSGAERRAREALGRVHRRYRTPVLIETTRSLDGAWIADVAWRRAKVAGADRLYILVARDERDVGVVGARRGLASRLTDQQRETIRRAFLGPLEAGRPDEAFDQGVRAVGTAFEAAAARPRPGVRDALISGAIPLGALGASRVWAWDGRRSRRRRRTSARRQAGGSLDAVAAGTPRAVSAGGSVALRHSH